MNISQTTQDAVIHIQETCKAAAESLSCVAKLGPQAIHTFPFDLTTLKDFSEGKIQQDPEHQAAFQQLAKIKGPVVYVFEIASTTNPAAVVAAARAYHGPRVMPAFRRTMDDTSTVLYVGKVKTQFQNRVIQHLGFCTTAATQGLQLFHWSRALDLEVHLTAFEFKTEMASLLPILENALARSLRPLIGKHT